MIHLKDRGLVAQELLASHQVVIYSGSCIETARMSLKWNERKRFKKTRRETNTRN